MSTFTHLVMTRFNVRMSFGGWALPDEAWHYHRFSLFETFCLPSLRGQVNAEFKWLVFFDRGTPDVFKEKIATYARWDRFIPCYVDVFNEAMYDAVREQIDPGSTHLITTRVDNDDALAADYLIRVQAQFDSQDCEFLDFRNGYLLMTNHDQLFLSRLRSNPFISLIEDVRDFRTVFCAGHRQVSKIGPLRPVESEPVWMIVVHDKNASTRGLKHRIEEVPISVLNERFSLNYKPGERSNSTER